MLLMMIVACQSYSSASVVGIQRKGFVSMPFNQSFYNIQSPYNLPQTKRYSFLNGVHKCWVYSNDLPLSRTSQTKPRTEIAIKGYVYNSGVWEFQGYGYVPSGTSGVSIMQILGSWPPRATSLMLMVYDGSLCYYNESQVVLRNVYDKWFKLNVIDDFDTGKIKVYINDELKLEVQGRGGKNHIFKCGVYAQLNDSRLMESRWRDIRIFKKV
ncbi:Citrate-binding protein [Linum perenne]